MKAETDLTEALVSFFSQEEVGEAVGYLSRWLGKGEGRGREEPHDVKDLAALLVLGAGIPKLPPLPPLPSSPEGQRAVGKSVALLLYQRSSQHRHLAERLVAASATLEVFGEGREVLESLLRQAESVLG